jgi:hypothetical protein
MAIQLPLVIVGGQTQRLQAGDTVDDPKIGSTAPGSFSVVAGQFAFMTRVTLIGAQRITLAGDACVRIG